MKRFILILICIFIASFVIAQDTNELENPFLGEWKIEWIDWNDERVDEGLMVFFDDFHCEISNNETRHFDYHFSDMFLFIGDLGYYWEWTNKERNIIKITPGHGSDLKRIYLTKILEDL
jgi:hypothetical protein